MTTWGGTLPERKPGIFISRPSSAAALCSSRSRASLGTSTFTRTRESPSSVVAVFTIALTVPCTVVKPRDRLLAWIVTGPLGHLWSALADIALLLARSAAGKLRPGR